MAAMSDPKGRRLSGLWVLVVFPIIGILAAVRTLTGFPGVSQNREQAVVSGVSVGQPAPDFTGSTPDGQSTRLSDSQGSIVAVTFWSWIWTMRSRTSTASACSR